MLPARGGEGKRALRPLGGYAGYRRPADKTERCGVHEDRDSSAAESDAPDGRSAEAGKGSRTVKVLPPPDPQVERIHSILQSLHQDARLTQVRDLAERAGMSERTLQQLFSEYVGVTPKWVIRRYRLHEAADQLANGADVDLAELAHGLGYFDQAHFTRDFRRLVGKAPAEYRRANQA